MTRRRSCRPKPVGRAPGPGPMELKRGLLHVDVMVSDMLGTITGVRIRVMRQNGQATMIQLTPEDALQLAGVIRGVLGED